MRKTSYGGANGLGHYGDMLISDISSQSEIFVFFFSFTILFG